MCEGGDGRMGNNALQPSPPQWRYRLGWWGGALSATFVFLIPALDALATSSPPVTISGSIAANCVLTTTTLNFGAYDPVQVNKTTPLTVSATIKIACTTGTTTTLTIDTGLNPTHAVGASRAMASGSDYLSYELYTTSSKTTVWSTANAVSNAATSKAPTSELVYGSIPAGQNVAAGSYSDTVTVTATY